MGEDVFKSFDVRKLVLATLALASVACSKTEYVYQTNPNTNEGQSSNGSAYIPPGVWLDGVNAVNFYSTSEGLVIKTDNTTNLNTFAGGFNGQGTGNKAYVGLTEFNGMRISDIETIEVEARQDRGTSLAFLNLQVDCNGDGIYDSANDGIIVVDSDASSDVSLSFDFPMTSFRRISFSADQPLFKSVNGSCGLPEHLQSKRVSLSALPASARLFNGSTGDFGMPRDTVMPSVLFVMNDSNQKQAKQVTLRELKLNDKSFRFHQD